MVVNGKFQVTVCLKPQYAGYVNPPRPQYAGYVNPPRSAYTTVIHSKRVK